MCHGNREYSTRHRDQGDFSDGSAERLKKFLGVLCLSQTLLDYATGWGRELERLHRKRE